MLMMQTVQTLLVLPRKTMATSGQNSCYTAVSVTDPESLLKMHCRSSENTLASFYFFVHQILRQSVTFMFHNKMHAHYIRELYRPPNQIGNHKGARTNLPYFPTIPAFFALFICTRDQAFQQL